MLAHHLCRFDWKRLNFKGLQKEKGEAIRAIGFACMHVVKDSLKRESLGNNAYQYCSRRHKNFGHSERHKDWATHRSVPFP
eukprot:5740485-Amphidinium_carterae.2